MPTARDIVDAAGRCAWFERDKILHETSTGGTPSDGVTVATKIAQAILSSCSGPATMLDDEVARLRTAQEEQRQWREGLAYTRGCNETMAGVKPAMDALRALVGADVAYVGNTIVIDAGSHGEAVRLVREARDALAKIQGEAA